MKLLCLSNGHGEDVVAVQILKQLQQSPNVTLLAALPLVGEGHAYLKQGIPMIGPVQNMPSGGFIYMDGRQLWRDFKGGLLPLTLAQYQAIRRWCQTGGKILAIGDIVPLLFAWASGADYAFVGTAKSEYYLQDEAGWLPQTSWLERRLGGVYLPWERWLLRHPRCQAVFTRDKLTAERLEQYSIPATYLGNPMMDDVPATRAPMLPDRKSQQALVMLLLPGSRPPEALENWQLILEAIEGILATGKQTVFLGAIAPSVALEPLQQSLLADKWQPQSLEQISVSLSDPQALAFTRQEATLLLTQTAYSECLQLADLAIAMAGTATEQWVGTGKAAIVFPGRGPQFTPAFAEAQSRLLGPSLILVERPDRVPSAVQSLLNDPARRQLIAQNGRRRMGAPGAAARIAQRLIELMQP